MFKEWKIRNAYIVEGEQLYHINTPLFTIGVEVIKVSTHLYEYKINYVITGRIYLNERHFKKYKDITEIYMDTLLSLYLKEMNNIKSI